MTRLEVAPTAEVRKVVITGGPVAGKSTAVEHLKGALAGSIVVVSEVATALLGGGYPTPSKDLEWSQEWQSTFQDAVFHVQNSAEKASVIAARQRGNGLVVADRGLLDGAAYFKGGRDEFAERYGIDVDETMASYNAVIHLESIAVRGRSAWEELRTNNPSRFRPYEAVLAFEDGVREAWDGHPNHYVVTEYELDDRLLAVEAIVRAIHAPNM
jgi:predicted ATPase